MINPPYPELDELLEMMGEAGKRLSEIEACEGAAGNISICVRWPVDPSSRFPLIEEIELPRPVPELAGTTLLVSGSGSRLREIIVDPAANVGCIVVREGGNTGTLYTTGSRNFQRVTSEFNSHLAVHYDQMLASNSNFHAVIHAQPLHLTYLSHLERYGDEQYLNSHLLRWQPETIINLPEGIGFIPFRLPGSQELMDGNLVSLRDHRIVVWARHGVMARSDISVKNAADRIEYAETAAKYEYLNLAAGDPGEGLSPDEVRAICVAFSIDQHIF
jgi:rhamnulose-1-phosphate aldolase